MIRWLALVACVLTLGINVASAFLRHSHAGMGCEPWPACYREAAGATPTPVIGADTVLVVRALHRVSAVLVGFLILGLLLFGWASMGAGERVAAVVALADTVFLAWLGRFTPSELPLVTLGNVLGGLVLAAAFGWIAARPRVTDPTPVAGQGRLRRLAIGGAALAVLQSAVGVMISVRHAADACADALCAPQSAVLPGLFDPTVAMVVQTAADGRPLHLVHRLIALALVACVLAMLWGARGRSARGERPGAPGEHAWPAAILVLLAAAGIATAAGAPGHLTGTLHNLLAGILLVSFVVLVRRAGLPVIPAQTAAIRWSESRSP